MSIMRFVLTILVFFFVHSSFGQQSYEIRGTIKDTTGNSISSATVYLIDSGTKRKVRSTSADSVGQFRFAVVPQGSYRINARAIGYNEIETETFLLSERTILFFSIQLLPSIKVLQGITIEATKSALTADGEKITYSLQDDPSSKGLSLTEVMAKLPFLSVTGEGMVLLKGQSTYKMLINGKPSGLFSSGTSEFLKSFPVDLIERIEIINSAGAKYEGEGVTGIINIITKRKFKGYNGSSSFNASTIGQINPNTSFNFKSGKIGVSAFAYMAKNTGYSVHGKTIFHNVTDENERIMDENGTNKGYQTGVNAEITYDIDSLQILSLYGRLAGAGGENSRDVFIQTYDFANLVSSGNRRILDELRLPAYEAGIDYIKKDALKNEMSVSFNVQKNRNDISTNSFENSSQTGERRIFNFSKAANLQSIFSFDRSIIKKNSFLEFGSKIVLRNAESNYKGSYKYQNDPGYKVDSTNSNDFKYDQNIFALYGSWKFQHAKKWSFRSGLRIEKTTVKGAFGQSLTEVNQDYISLLPAFLFTSMLKRYTLSISYQKKIARPGITYLNPYIDNRDSAFVIYGNENLKPERSNLFEIILSKFKSNFSVSTGLSFIRTKGSIQRFISYDTSTRKGTQTYLNSGLSNQLGLNCFFSVNASRAWTLSTNINAYYISFKDVGRTYAEGSQFSVNESIRYDNKKKFLYYSNFNYSSPVIQLQGRGPSNIFYNVGVGHRLMKDKVTLTLTAFNFFKETRRLFSKFKTDQLVQEINLYRPFRSFSIGIRYNFGNLKENVSKKKNVTGNDLKEINLQ